MKEMLVTPAGQAAMAGLKRHSRVEVATKLAQANDLAKQGKLQGEIARTLGVSIWTLHRWRKEADEPNRTRSGDDRIAELQLENSRLRRLVTDILLETIKFKEAAQSATGRRPARQRVIIEKRPDGGKD